MVMARYWAEPPTWTKPPQFWRPLTEEEQVEVVEAALGGDAVVCPACGWPAAVWMPSKSAIHCPAPLSPERRIAIEREGVVYVDEDSTCGFTWKDEMTREQKIYYQVR